MSAAVPPDSPAVRPRSLVDRVKGILLTPHAEWQVIDREPATVGSIYTGYVLILAAIPAICAAIGLSLIGMNVPLLGELKIGPMVAVRVAVVRYLSALIGVYVLALIIDALAPSFGGQKNQVQAFKVAAYSATAAWVVGIFSLLPALSILGLLGLYSLYLLYVGLPILMKSPTDRALGYTVIVILAAFVVFAVVGYAANALSGMPGVGMGYR